MAQEPEEAAPSDERREGLSRRALLNTAGAVGGGVLAATVLTGTASAQAPSSTITGTRFSITIDGYEIASFSELAGIVAEVEPSEYWETNGESVPVNRLPGKIKPPQITLKRGLNSNLELWAWHEAVRTGQIGAARRSCSLTIFNKSGQPVGKYWLEKAWPNKIDLSSAGAGEALLETVVLTCEYIQRVAP